MKSKMRFLSAVSYNIIQKATHKNFVLSNVMKQIEKDCEQYCYIPNPPYHKVTILGAGSDVGRIAALFLKQQRVIKVLSLYDDGPEHVVMGVASDLAHIDTSTHVEAFQGRAFLREALYRTAVVLICGGNYVMPPSCNKPDHHTFIENMHYVRSMTLACTAFCPGAVIAVQTPPVDANFALCKHVLKGARQYNKRRLLGVNAINAMRANQLFCSITGADPAASNIPCVGGTSRCTRVPVFSAGKGSNVPQSQLDCLTRLVREADDIICTVKSNFEQGHLSIGFSTARFITNIMNGLYKGSAYIDSALVEQADPSKCYDMHICATPVKVGKGGITDYVVPTLNEPEKRLLEDSKCDLADLLNLGRCYATGEDYYVHPCKYYKVPCYNPCPTCEELLKKQRKG